jgi:hypothetical protein
LSKAIGRIPDDIPDLARDLKMADAKNLYRIARDLSIDPAHLVAVLPDRMNQLARHRGFPARRQVESLVAELRSFCENRLLTEGNLASAFKLAHEHQIPWPEIARFASNARSHGYLWRDVSRLSSEQIQRLLQDPNRSPQDQRHPEEPRTEMLSVHLGNGRQATAYSLAGPDGEVAVRVFLPSSDWEAVQRQWAGGEAEVKADMTHFRRVQMESGVERPLAAPEPLFWDPESKPFFVMLGDAGGMVLTGPNGVEVALTVEAVVSALDRDQALAGLAPNAPVVLLGRGLGGGGLELPRALAQALRRTVWVNTAEARLARVGDGETTLDVLPMQVGVDSEGTSRELQGYWIRTEPPVLGGYVPRDGSERRSDDEEIIKDISGEELRIGDIVTSTITDATGHPVGRSFLAPADVARDEVLVNGFNPDATMYVHVTGDDEHIVENGRLVIDRIPLDSQRPIYVVDAHGDPGRVRVYTKDGPRTISGPSMAKVVRRRPSVQALGENAQIMMSVCYAGAEADGRRSLIQDVGDAVRRETFGPTGRFGPTLDESDRHDGFFVGVDQETGQRNAVIGATPRGQEPNMVAKPGPSSDPRPSGRPGEPHLLAADRARVASPRPDGDPPAVVETSAPGVHDNEPVRSIPDFGRILTPRGLDDTHAEVLVPEGEDSQPERVEGLSEAQAARLGELALRAVDMPANGDCFFHALIRLAPEEVAAGLGSSGVQPTPAAVRAHVADALTQDLALPETSRNLWSLLDAQAFYGLIGGRTSDGQTLTDAHRRMIIDSLRTSGSYDNAAGDIAPVVAGQVFGLHLTVVLADGTPYEVGDPSGRPVVLARLPREARGYDHWVAAVPKDAVPKDAVPKEEGAKEEGAKDEGVKAAVPEAAVPEGQESTRGEAIGQALTGGELKARLDPVRLRALGKFLKVKDLANLERLSEAIGRLPEDIPRLAADLEMQDAKNLYRIARDLLVDPADLIAVLPDRMRRLAGRRGVSARLSVQPLVEDIRGFCENRLHTEGDLASAFHVARRYKIPWPQMEQFGLYARARGHRWGDLRRLPDSEVRGLLSHADEFRRSGFEPGDLRWFSGVVDSPGAEELRGFAGFLSDNGETPAGVRATGLDNARDLVVRWRLELTWIAHMSLEQDPRTRPHDILALTRRFGVDQYAPQIAGLTGRLGRVPDPEEIIGIADRMRVQPRHLLEVAALLGVDPADLRPFGAIRALGDVDGHVTVNTIANRVRGQVGEMGIRLEDLGWFSGLLHESHDIRSFLGEYQRQHPLDQLWKSEKTHVRGLVREWAAGRLGITADAYEELAAKSWWKLTDAVTLRNRLRGGYDPEMLHQWLLRIDRLPVELPELAKNSQVEPIYLFKLASELQADPRHLAPFVAEFGRFPEPEHLASVLRAWFGRLGVVPEELGRFVGLMDQVGLKSAEWWDFGRYLMRTSTQLVSLVGSPADEVRTLVDEWRNSGSAREAWQLGLSEEEYREFAARPWFDHDALTRLGRELWISDMRALVEYSAGIGEVPSGVTGLAERQGIGDPYELLELAQEVGVRPSDLDLFTKVPRTVHGGLEDLSATRSVDAGVVKEMRGRIEQVIHELGLEGRELSWFTGLVAGFDREAAASFGGFLESRGLSVGALREGTIEGARQSVAEWQSGLGPERLGELAGGRSYSVTAVVEAGRRLGVLQMDRFVEYVVKNGLSSEELTGLPELAAKWGLRHVNDLVEFLTEIGAPPQNLRTFERVFGLMGQHGLSVRIMVDLVRGQLQEWGLSAADLVWFSGIVGSDAVASIMDGHSVEELRKKPIEDVRRTVARSRLGTEPLVDDLDVVELAAFAYELNLGSDPTRPLVGLDDDPDVVEQADFAYELQVAVAYELNLRSDAMGSLVGMVNAIGRLPVELPSLTARWGVPARVVMEVARESGYSMDHLTVLAGELSWLGGSRSPEPGLVATRLLSSRLELLGFEPGDLSWLAGMTDEAGLRIGDLANFRHFLENRGQSIDALRSGPAEQARDWAAKWHAGFRALGHADRVTHLRGRILVEVDDRGDVDTEIVGREYLDKHLRSDLERLTETLSRVPDEIPYLAQSLSLSPATLVRVAAATNIDPFSLVTLFATDLRYVERPPAGFVLENWAEGFVEAMWDMGLGDHGNGHAQVADFLHLLTGRELEPSSRIYLSLNRFLHGRGSSLLRLISRGPRDRQSVEADFEAWRREAGHEENASWTTNEPGEESEPDPATLGRLFAALNPEAPEAVGDPMPAYGGIANDDTLLLLGSPPTYADVIADSPRHDPPRYADAMAESEDGRGPGQDGNVSSVTNELAPAAGVLPGNTTSYVNVLAERWGGDPEVIADMANGLGVPPERLEPIMPMVLELSESPEPGPIEWQIRLLRDAGAVAGVLSDGHRSWLFGFAADLNRAAGGSAQAGLVQALDYCLYAKTIRGYSVDRLSRMSSDELRDMMDTMRELYYYEPPVQPHNPSETNLSLRRLIGRSLGALGGAVNTPWEHKETVEDLADLAHRIGTTDLETLLQFSNRLHRFPEELPDLAVELQVPADYLLRVASRFDLAPNDLRVLREDLRRLHGKLRPEDFNVDLRARLSAMGLGQDYVSGMGLGLDYMGRFIRLAARLEVYLEEFQDLSDFLRRRQTMSLRWLTTIDVSHAELVVKAWRETRAKIADGKPDPATLGTLFAALKPEAPGRSGQ